jgi:UDP-GlcNAc:undecaprenyl-phosphate/decaprenyl-phosphate GlcNAc-1-phosphate transferase
MVDAATRFDIYPFSPLSGPLALYWRIGLANVIVAVLTSTLLFYLVVILAFPASTSYPPSVFTVDSLLLIMFLSGIRLIRRLYPHITRPSRSKRVLIYGAGDAGERIVRDMQNNPAHPYQPIGSIDDDPAKRGQQIHGVQVLGTRKDLHTALPSAYRTNY